MNNTYDTVIDRLHRGVNPWTEYLAGDTSHHNSWGSTEPIFRTIMEELQPQLIIEVGSFLGGSSIHMASLMKAMNLPERCIICVDTWLAEEILWSQDVERKLLHIVNGTPMFYYTFLNNVKDKGHDDTIVPLRMPSLPASRYLKQNGIKAPFIYIDGTHIVGEVLRDLEVYWDLLLPGGIMLIDDFSSEDMFAGVVKDTAIFAIQRGLRLEVAGKKAFIRKP